MAAVNNIGWALEFISQDLIREREIVMAAIKQNGSALHYV